MILGCADEQLEITVCCSLMICACTFQPEPEALTETKDEQISSEIFRIFCKNNVYSRVPQTTPCVVVSC